MPDLVSLGERLPGDRDGLNRAADTTVDIREVTLIDIIGKDRAGRRRRGRRRAQVDGAETADLERLRAVSELKDQPRLTGLIIGGGFEWNDISRPDVAIAREWRQERAGARNARR